MKYLVKDNFLDEANFEVIKQNIIGCNLPWYIAEGISGKDEGCYLTHLVFNECRQYSNDILTTLNPLLEKLDVFALRRIKINFYPVTSTVVEHSFHVDYDTPHVGAIFYLNTNDGFTILNDGKKIASVQNRLLLFEAHLDHKSTTCTNDPLGRFNINLNYAPLRDPFK